MTCRAIRSGCAVLIAGCFLFCSVLVAPPCAAQGWRAGVARQVITPERLMWMAGYGARNRPAEGKLHDLWAKALVLEDAQGRRGALVTLDLVGIDRGLAQSIRAALQQKVGLRSEQIVLCVSHTHTGPVVAHNLRAMHYDLLDSAQQELVAQYTAELARRVVAATEQAVAALAPAEVRFGRGQTDFAVNRRNNREPDVPRLRDEGKLQGPVDHDVPVLAVKNARGELIAAVSGYACHATTLDFYQWSGDYPGFYQLELEKRRPGCVAMFVAGCGGDQNPLPRRSVELAEKYGRQLAEAVDQVLSTSTKPVAPRLTTRYREASLPLGPLPSLEQLRRDKDSPDRFVASRARRLLEQMESGTPLAADYPYPIAAWDLGDEVRFVALGGEVVVDYSLRLKQELTGGRENWIAGYANDVMAYIPSRRVLVEGGYEGGGAMVYYGLPAAWAPEVEETIVRAVRELVAP